MSKGLIALKEYRSQQPGVNVYADDHLNIIEKELKALEIIKRTALDLVSLNEEDCCFYDGEMYLKRKLTQEEYDLLKEVLL